MFVAPNPNDIPLNNDWRLTDRRTETKFVDGKKYILGMGITAERPLIPTEDRFSNIELKNQESYLTCVHSVVKRQKFFVGWSVAACDFMYIDIPVPYDLTQFMEQVESDSAMTTIASGTLGALVMGVILSYSL
jgi:hypothetical protein